MTTTRAAVVAFDLDGTLLDGQSGTLILRYLQKHGYLRYFTVVACAWWGVRYKLHLPFRQNEVRERIFADLHGLDPDEVRALMRRFHEEVMVPRYRRDGVAELRRHVEAGRHVALISATFDDVAQAAAEYLGCDVALATVMRRDADGRFTGQVEGEVTAGPEKVRRIRAWADQAFGVDGWTLVEAYGDHHTDLPMLEAAEHCCAVNPGPTLRREAERRGWPVLSWK